MAGPQVYFTWPSVFQPIPSPLPQPLPPPVKERSFRSPFGIDKTLFDFALRPEVPILFATTYIFTVFALNAYNRKRQHKPWAISKTRVFHWFVVLHNVLLALYSAATFAAMLRAILHTWPEGGITSNPNEAAGVADALCKLHGPRGLGDAATFNTTINIWEVKNTAIRLGYDGNPDPTDVGRLWNEGLAFWGFIFYMSKFYEVVDTMIIIAKGKRSATLQTYHHAGAMLCMWAGIRFMSPPIWMFVFINSAIHAMMYTYFTLSALGYRVPQALKRTLTSLQIAQFLFGASYAAMHLFVQYDIPISTPYYVASTVQRAASSASSAAASITASASSDISSAVASPTATATLGALLKKLLLRAAGEEGLAERVHRERRSNPANLIPTPGLVPDLPTVPDMADKIQQFNEETFYETRWRTDWTKVDCIDTSGEAFAIYLNLLYLAPLTFLFGRFFVKAYTQRGRKGRARSISEAAKQAIVAGIEGEKRAEEAVEAKGKKVEGKAPFDDEATKKLEEQVREDVRRLAERFGVSQEVMILGVTLYVCGFACGPLVWGPLSELYGRRNPLMAGMIGFIVFQIPVAVAPNIQTIMVCRFFGGAFGSAPLAIVAGAYVDFWDMASRGIATMAYAGAVFAGPTIGPIVGEFTVKNPNLGPSWTLWFTMIMAAFFVVLALPTVPESLAPIILRKKAARLRFETKDWALHSRLEEEPVKMGALLRKYGLKPMQMIVMEPILIAMTLYISLVYGILYLIFFAFPFSFEYDRGFEFGVSSLPFVAVFIGVLVACGYMCWETRVVFTPKLIKAKKPIPEERLPSMMLGSVVLVIGMFWFAWTSYPSINPWPQIISGAFIGAGIIGVFMPAVIYLVDVYLFDANSALAANALVRSFVAAAFPLFSTYMYQDLGTQWASCLLAFLCLALVPFPIVFYFYGKRIRSKSKFAFNFG